jgi:polyhydroxyalkanoate synthesis regulator phasin
MSSKLDELRRRAEEAARQIDEKFEIKSKLDQGARAATGALRKGAEAASSTIDAAREEVSRLDREHRVSERLSENARRAANAAGDAFRSSGIKDKASEAAGDAAKKAGEVVDDAKQTASDLFGDARRYYENASGAARASVSAARLPSSILSALASARAWAKKNPGKAAVVSLAFIAGTRAGSAFSSLDVVVLGAGGAGHWLFHSAVVPYGLRKLSQKYEAYLKRQDQLIAEGKLSEAEAARIKFQRDAAKYVGAPLLGAFSVAAGAGLVAEAVTGGGVAGFPINIILGGNPLLSSVWLFGNGLVCFYNGYKFFMMALADQEEVARVVRDIKGLLPAETS